MFREPDQPCQKLFIGRISADTTEDDIREAFGKFGSIQYASVKSKDTGNFAFVEFSSIDQATNAMNNMNNQELKGANIRINFSKPRNGQNNAGGGGGGGFQAKTQMATEEPVRERSRDDEKQKSNWAKDDKADRETTQYSDRNSTRDEAYRGEMHVYPERGYYDRRPEFYRPAQYHPPYYAPPPPPMYSMPPPPAYYPPPTYMAPPPPAYYPYYGSAHYDPYGYRSRPILELIDEREIQRLDAAYPCERWAKPEPKPSSSQLQLTNEPSKPSWQGSNQSSNNGGGNNINSSSQQDGGNRGGRGGGRGGAMGGGGGRGCFNCGQEGHMSRECPQPRAERGRGRGRGGASSTPFGASNDRQETINNDNGEASRIVTVTVANDIDEY